MTDPKELTKSLRNDDDLSSRIEAADLIESLETRLIETQAALEAEREACAAFVIALPNSNRKATGTPGYWPTTFQEVADGIRAGDHLKAIKDTEQ